MSIVSLAPSNEVAFFEIAATLIPILLFGGVITERIQPPSEKKWRYLHIFMAPYFPLFGALALFAEALAIRAVVVGDGTQFDRILVAAILVLGMTAVVMTISAPWLSGLQRKEKGAYGNVAWLSAAAVILGAVGSFILLIDGVDVADEGERAQAISKEVSKNLAEQDAVRHRAESLTRELGRISQQQQVALERGDFVVYKSLDGQSRLLTRLVTLAFNEEERLMLKAANLVRELAGEPTLKHLPYEKPKKE